MFSIAPLQIIKKLCDLVTSDYLPGPPLVIIKRYIFINLSVFQFLE